MAEVHSTFFHSLIQMSGTILGFALIFVFFAFLSNLFARFAKIKPQNSLLILPDAEGNKEWLSKSAPVLLQISIAGTIGKEDLSLEQIETQLTESKMGDLRKDRVKGILLKIDSPGGSATDSDAIYRRLKAYKAKHGIPIYAYVEGICASGSFLVACASDKIFASPTSIVGSVGVMWMLPFFNVHKVLEKWEIDVKTFSEGKHKDHLNPFRPWHPGEDSDLKNLLSHAYSRFVDLVSKERPKLTQEKLIHEIGAQIYSAPVSAR
jgi:signal peptide peptidase SppA